MKHTPGPWDDISLVELLSKPAEEVEANIRLMGEAPEMLKSIEDALKMLRKYDALLTGSPIKIISSAVRSQINPVIYRLNGVIKKAES